MYTKLSKRLSCGKTQPASGDLCSGNGLGLNCSILRVGNNSPSVSDPLKWMCESILANPKDCWCNPNTAMASVPSWRVGGFPVSYCLSEIVSEKCKLQFSLRLIVT